MLVLFLIALVASLVPVSAVLLHRIQDLQPRRYLARPIHQAKPTTTFSSQPTEIPTTTTPIDDETNLFPPFGMSAESSIENAGALPFISGVPKMPPSDSGDLSPLPAGLYTRRRRQEQGIPEPSDDLRVLPRVSGTPNRPPRAKRGRQ